MPTDSQPKWTLDRVDDAIATFQTQRRYQYHSLDPKKREIRLLKISLPATGDPILGLELETTSIDSAHPFQAISYCWRGPKQGGTEQSYHKVPISDKAPPPDTSRGELSWIAVTESLADMLAYLPRHCIPSGHESSYIWIGQLCINQNDENSSEKENQIELMGEVYRRATQVLIWLGPGPSPEVAERIQKIDILRDSPLSSEDRCAMRYVWENSWFKRT